METKAQIIDRQISIREKETELHSETQQLLFDILHRMTPEQQEKLIGYTVSENDNNTISGNFTLYGFDVDNGDDNFTVSIDDLGQIEQKQLIDHILLNNLID